MGAREIEQFWSTFRAQARGLGPRSDHAFTVVAEALRSVDPRIRLIPVYGGGLRHAVLSAEGDLDVGPVIDAVVAAPPPAGWAWLATVDAGLLDDRRNPSLFPPDASGEVLFRMARGGDRLWRPRDVAFGVTFPSEAAAESFLTLLDAVAEPKMDGELETFDDVGWEEGALAYGVVVTVHLVPSHARITTVERLLATLAAPLGGTNAGWGSTGALGQP
ncbi:MAG: ribonuclease E inhibitor RraB [Myxococcota bacterium]